MDKGSSTFKEAAVGLLDSVSRSVDTLVETAALCVEKVFGGKFLFALAAAYGLVYIIENGNDTDPLVASLITLIIKSYFDKDSLARGAMLPPLEKIK